MLVLSKVVDDVLKANPKTVEDAKTMGRAKHYLVGLVLKELGVENPFTIKSINDMLIMKLGEK